MPRVDLAERVKLHSFPLLIAMLAAFIYPVIGSWTWGGGWLAAIGFRDLAGSTIVQSTDGCAALAAVLVVGARRGKFRPDGTVRQTPPNNVPMVTLGAFIVWMGILAFNAGSHTGLAGVPDAVALSNIFVNSNLAAAAVVAVCLSRWVLGRIDLLAWLVIDYAVRCRISETAERLGQDAALGIESFPEFLRSEEDE